MTKVSDTVTVRQIADNERPYWDEHIQTFTHVHPFNAYEWGTVRKVDGWTPIYLVAERGGRFCGGLLLLSKRLPFLPYRIFYGPHGPVFEAQDRATFRAIHAKVLEMARKSRAIFMRIDPNIREDQGAEFEQEFAELGYRHLEQRWTFWNSPRDEYRIDFDEHVSVDECHQTLDRDTRRCIRKGAKDGLSIEPATKDEELEAFYDIFKSFTVNKGFMARGAEYQKTLWQRYCVSGNGRLFLAKHEGHIIGGLLCILFGRKCVAMHMGTPYKYQKLQASYAYVWESIRWAKESGCTWYSFRGVGTTPTQEAFKSKFNPKVVSLVGYFDRPFRPRLYRLFYWLEFTVLPASWPLIVKSRKIAGSVTNRLAGQAAPSQ